MKNIIFLIVFVLIFTQKLNSQTTNLKFHDCTDRILENGDVLEKGCISKYIYEMKLAIKLRGFQLEGGVNGKFENSLSGFLGAANNIDYSLYKAQTYNLDNQIDKPQFDLKNDLKDIGLPVDKWIDRPSTKTSTISKPNSNSNKNNNSSSNQYNTQTNYNDVIVFDKMYGDEHAVISTNNKLQNQFSGEWIMTGKDKFEKVVFIGNKVAKFSAFRGKVDKDSESELKYYNEKREKINNYTGKWIPISNKNYAETTDENYYTYELKNGILYETFTRYINQYDQEVNQSLDYNYNNSFRKKVKNVYPRKVKFGYNPFKPNAPDISDEFYNPIK